MFVDLSEETLTSLMRQLDPEDDMLAVRYFNLIQEKGRQVFNDTEIPKGYLPSRVQIVLRPYLKPLGHRFGYRITGGEMLWGFYKFYERKTA
ncbi:hypothetical protein CRN36_12365 [Vibrio vulnificus]|nr:hypothetical protein CRN36_12365 [Vibrio vulnificus]